MNPEIKKRWVDALNSGEYTQCKGSLNKGNSFCCLGVLCDLYSKENGVAWDISKGSTYSPNTFLNMDSVLPKDVLLWAGLEINDPIIYDRETNQLSASSWNDSYNETFSEIAEMIDYSL